MMKNTKKKLKGQSRVVKATFTGNNITKSSDSIRAYRISPVRSVSYLHKGLISYPIAISVGRV
jgi:hypothetical protein